ncbi:MAG: phosphoribosylamine--glycine ligase [Victivallaceae bacterium]|nr:phosphoribosylamine--glycine ligase [Victivallaceae bacterium]
MKVLVIGSGGREHALCWALAKSSQVDEVFCAPGNAGIASVAKCVDIGVCDTDKLVDFAVANDISLVAVGPELPLCNGVADAFRAKNIPVFGPSGEAAQLEGSKDFAKEFMLRHGIPTARGASFSDASSARKYIEGEFASGANGIVVKADGLAAGKGVLVAETLSEALEFSDGCFGGAFGDSGSKVVIEEKLSGEEASLLALCDGNTIVPLVSSQDHKRIWDGDTGLNTGGMGAYSPAPVVTPKVEKRIREQILDPFLRGIQEEKLDFRGVIFVGLMIDKGMPKVLEFNVRFGDPEIQPVLRRFEGDWFEVLRLVACGRLADAKLVWSDEPAVSVVMAAGGYPGHYDKGDEIFGLDDAAAAGAVVFHAGTKLVDGKVVTAGGRVLGVSYRAKDIPSAIAGAYAAVGKISWKNVQYRKDIAQKALRPHEDI